MHPSPDPKKRAQPGWEDLFKPPAQFVPRTLDDLMLWSRQTGVGLMQGAGSAPPVLFILGDGGVSGLGIGQLATPADKDRFATMARLFCTAHAASAAVLVLEAWMSFAKPGQSVEKLEPPSEAFDRSEVLLLMGEERGRTVAQALPIIRTDAGGFFGLGENRLPPDAQLQGRFSGLLPPKIPTKKQRRVAMTLLKATGTIPSSQWRER